MSKVNPLSMSELDCPKRCADCRLRASPSFHRASEAELQFVESQRLRTRGVPAGQALFVEGDTGAGLFTLYSGWAFRYKTLPDGRRQILNFLLPGDLVGLQEEFASQSVHGVEALTHTLFCEFAQDALWNTLTAHPRLAYGVIWRASHTEQFLDANLLTTGQRSAVERIAMLLIHLYRRTEALGMHDGDSAPLPLQQLHIADALGLSLVHTNRSLRRLHALGMISIAKGRLRLFAERKLERIAEYYDRPPSVQPLL